MPGDVLKAEDILSGGPLTEDVQSGRPLTEYMFKAEDRLLKMFQADDRSLSMLKAEDRSLDMLAPTSHPYTAFSSTNTRQIDIKFAPVKMVARPYMCAKPAKLGAPKRRTPGLRRARSLIKPLRMSVHKGCGRTKHTGSPSAACTTDVRKSCAIGSSMLVTSGPK